MSLAAIYLCTSVLFTALNAQPQCTDSNNNACDFCLSQSRFNGGTYRMQQSGLYCLTENIVFNPILDGNLNSPNQRGWFPTNSALYPGSQTLDDGAYALGFFAVITVEASDVQIVLNGYKIEYDVQFLIQQRFGSIIEIGASPFLPNAGPANFGTQFDSLSNIQISNGILGLSSHHGIHANNASNVILSDLQIQDFEVGGIQLNGFNGVQMRNLQIGPSLHSTPLTAYYSNARFSALAMKQLLDTIAARNLIMPSITFAYGETLTLQQVYNNLIQAMDLTFKYLTNTITEQEKESPLYPKALNLFLNRQQLPDGSALYGIVLNSFSVAVHGFGSSANIGVNMGQNAIMENIEIHDLKLATREVLAVYFDPCDDALSSTTTGQKGPFGDVMDITQMVSREDANLINQFQADLSGVQYTGNPLSDAQIALYVYREYPNDGGNYAYSSFIDDRFIQWASNGVPLPDCMHFVCNADIMFHTNKGVVGVRMDGIEGAEITNIKVSNIENVAPLASAACGSYSGPDDGAQSGTTPNQGAMAGDVRAISVVDGSLDLSGNIELTNLNSWFGDINAFGLMNDAVLAFDDGVTINIGELSAASKVTSNQLALLQALNQSPFPNNFAVCDLSITDGCTVINGQSVGLGTNDCQSPVFSADIALPETCTSSCDAYSVLLSDTYYDGEDMCLTYNVKQLFDANECEGTIRYLVLGMCENDGTLPAAPTNTAPRTDERVLETLIKSVRFGDTAAEARGQIVNGQIQGIRVDFSILDEATFTICLQDVFNVNGECSHTVGFKRSNEKPFCEQAFLTGLPCIDSEKFIRSVYGVLSGNNAALENEHEDIGLLKAVGINGWNTWYLIGVIGVVSIAVICVVVMGLLCWMKRKKLELELVATEEDVDGIEVESDSDDGEAGTTMLQGL